MVRKKKTTRWCGNVLNSLNNVAERRGRGGEEIRCEVTRETFFWILRVTSILGFKLVTANCRSSYTGIRNLRIHLGFFALPLSLSQSQSIRHSSFTSGVFP